jgi:transcription antitermination protein NusB
MNRRKSREIAMKLLFEMSINKEEYKEIIENFKEHTDVDLKDLEMEYISRVLDGVGKNTEVIDKKINSYLINWKLHRISKIDLAILRISTYEILFEEDIPDVVSVNEGIELAKKYSDEKSSTFINGVLGNMVSKA